MPLWPVAAREARSAARAPRTYGWRAAVAAVGIVVIPISLWVSRTAPSQGRAVFVAVSIMAFIYCLFGGILRTADAIAEEKRENTLGLLFLTDLKVADVLSGKLLASTATLFFGLLAVLPMLVIPVLLGGVTSQDLIQVAVCLVNSLFFSISVGFLVSTFFRQGWVTISVGLAAMLAIIFFIPLIAGLFGPFLGGFLLVLTPITMLTAIITHEVGINFWQTVAVTHLLAWLNILYTAHYLPKFWQERPRSERSQIRWERFRRLRFGSSTTRRRFRTRLLNRNPLFWLSGREQVSSFGLMVFLVFLCGLSLLAEWQQVIYALVAIHATILVRMASAASHSLAEDRKSGALELLLATSLSVREVLKGRWMALRRQFFGPALIAIMWHLFTIVWIEVMSPYPKISQILFVVGFTLALAWIATGWYGMWMGLRARHPVAAIWGTLAAVILVPLVSLGGLFSILAIFQIIPEYSYPGENNFEILGCAAWGSYLIALIGWTTHRVKRVFREAATDRYTDTQPIDWRPFWRLTWKVTAATALIIGGVWGVRAYINFSGERAFREALAAHPGFTLDTPTQPYIPDNQNLAQWDFLRPLNDSQPVSVRNPIRPGDKMPFDKVIVIPRHPVGSSLTQWRTGARYSFATNAGQYWDANYDRELIRLHEAARERPFVQFSIKSAPTAAIWQPPELFYGSLFNVPRLLSARAEKRLRDGEHPVDDILLGLRFANCVTNDPLTLGARTEMLFALIQPIYDGIHDHRWSDFDLQQLQNAFAQINPAQHFQLWREYVVRKVATNYENPPRGGPMGTPQIMIGSMPYFIGLSPTHPRLTGKVKAGQARMIQFALGPTNNLIQKFQHWDWQSSGLGDEQSDNALQEHFIAITGQSLNREITRVGQTKTAIDQAITTCAIERFRLAENKLPTTLDRLVPKYLPKVPVDFMTGAPLKYRLTDDGYVLYSVGENLLDDGGRLDLIETIKGRTQRTPRDWPWIYKN